MSVAKDPARLLDSEFAVIRTVCYSSLFGYPLTLDELQRGLIGVQLSQQALTDLLASSSSLRRVIDSQDGYYFLAGQDHLPDQRAIRRRTSLRILRQNRGMLKMICALPFTRIVALSGSAAHLNLEEDGDLDLFVVTRGLRIWSVALTILLMTKLLGKRKLICFNYLASDQRLKVDQADLFTANQIISLKTFIGKGADESLLKHNPFVVQAYPNFKGLAEAPVDCSPGPLLLTLKSLLEFVLNLGPAQLGEAACRLLYRKYLLLKSVTWTTPEEVLLDKDLLKLHTRGHRKRVYEEYNQVLASVLASLGVKPDTRAESLKLGPV